MTDPGTLPVPAPEAAHGGDEGHRRLVGWQRGLWVGVAYGLGLMGLLLLAFVGYTVMRVADLMSAEGAKDLSFAFSGMTLITLTLLRLLAMLVGAGMVFGGLVVSFYTHAQATQVQGEGGQGIKGGLATHSPGITAIVVGAIVIVSALLSKGDYRYQPTTYRLVTPEEFARMNAAGASPPNQAASSRRPTASEVLGEVEKKP